MRIISIDSVQGHERLAKDVLNSSGTVLMPAGTVMKKEYAKKLMDLDVEFIYIEDDIAQGVNLSESLEIQIKEECLESVRDIFLKYTYTDNVQKNDIQKVAENIIEEVMEQSEVIYSLSSIRNKSEVTYSHSINVCALSVIIAIKLKLSRKKIKDIAIGSLLHDIGFAYISMDYHKLKEETCSQKELKEIKKHVIYGYSAIENVEWLSATSKDIILKHHERIDGSGYPFRLRGEKIDIGTRIVSICDRFDSMAYGNLTKKVKVYEAIDYVVSHAGSKFDFEIVNIFMESVAAYPIGELVITNKGETGIVLRQNSKCPTRPVIRIIKDRNGKKLIKWVEKDLTKHLTLFIEDTIIT